MAWASRLNAFVSQKIGFIIFRAPSASIIDLKNWFKKSGREIMFTDINLKWVPWNTDSKLLFKHEFLKVKCCLQLKQLKQRNSWLTSIQ